MKVSLAIISVAASFLLSAANTPWLPAKKEVQFRPRLGKENVQIMRLNGERFASGKFFKQQSLNGTWKFKGLDCQAKPFGKMKPQEKSLMAENFDDSSWGNIEVPLNWWLNPATHYNKVPFKSKPYFRGYYRKVFDVPTLSADKSYILHFDNIGYEADIFVNGKFAGRHHGDFVPCDLNVTSLLKPGKNLVALRVLADQGPGKDMPFTRTYGARWIPRCIKGGIWHNVSLRETGKFVISRMLLDPAESCDSIKVRFRIENPGKAAAEVHVSGAIQCDEPGAEVPQAVSLGKFTLKSGINDLEAVIPYPGKAKQWSINDPNLYHVVLLAEKSGDIVAMRQERTGFRTMKVKGTGFEFNNKPIYLLGESAHSSSHGGTPNYDAQSIMRYLLTKHKENGIMLLRTAHMPMIREFYEVADEIGMMIYDEWSMCFVNSIDEKVFEKNNLAELEKLIIRDYNHPSVVLWSLGNENKHGGHPEIAAQMDKQYDLLKKIDRQNRPASAFSGVSNVDGFGRNKLKNDFLDIHHYQGMIDSSWTKWHPNFDLYYKWNTEIYGVNGKIKMPIIMWECVGAGWGHKSDRNFKLNNPADYLIHINKPMSWGIPGANGYSGAVGLAAALDPARGKHYVQSYLAGRLSEIFRQDKRLAGFGPWFSDFNVPEITRWSQPVLGGLRLNGNKNNSLMLRQLALPSTRKLECFILNQSSDTIAAGKVQIDLFVNGKTTRLTDVQFGKIAPVTDKVQKIDLRLPAGKSATGEIRLTVFDGNREIGRNYYRVRLHNAGELTAPAVNPQKVGLLGRNAALEKALKTLQIPFAFCNESSVYNYKCAILPPGNGKVNHKQLFNFVKTGGALLILEPGKGKLPVLTDFTVEPVGNHLTDLVVPAHPAFAGLTQADFELWSEMPYGETISKAITPANGGVLAMKPVYVIRKTPAMGAAEYSIGKGRTLISTLNTLALWDINPAATRYLRNLLVYLTGPGKKFNAELYQENSPLVFRADASKLVQLDLKRHMNRSFRDDTAEDRKGGWTDQGDNDFRMMPLGRQTFADIPFNIVDPAKNKGKSCVILRDRLHRDFPSSAKGIKVGNFVSAFYALHTAAWVSTTSCATYRLNYVDGTHYDYDLRCGRDIGDWWNPADLSNALAVCKFTNQRGGNVGWYVCRIINPYPRKKVRSLDIYSDGYANGDADYITPNGALPIIAAITAELAHSNPLEVLSASARPNKVRSTTERLRPGEKNAVKADLKTGKGGNRIAIHFPEIRGDRRPVVLVFFDTAKLKTETYRFFTLTYKSSSRRKILMRISEKSNKLGLLHSFELGNSEGNPVTLRLDLESDFRRLQDKKFPLSDLRGEILFFDDAKQEAGVLRPPASFEILEMRFE